MKGFVVVVIEDIAESYSGLSLGSTQWIRSDIMTSIRARVEDP